VAKAWRVTSAENPENVTSVNPQQIARRWLNLLFAFAPLLGVGAAEIRHSFLAIGAQTQIVAEDGSTAWSFPHSTRDGWVLPDGRILLALSKSDQHPGGAVVEVDRAGKIHFEFKGTQSEVNTAQRLANGNTLLTEAGPKPRVLEVNRAGEIVVEFPIQCQLTNFHMQTRMTRKLANGNYLIPHLLDKVVREHKPDGAIAWSVPTPNWAFTAIRLPNDNTLVGCTYGNVVVELDPLGKIAWQLSNDDLEGDPIKDACGVQRLANGNTVVTSYGIGEHHRKLTEVTPDKKVVWTYTDSSRHGIHHFQILTTNGRPEPTPALR
jgi:hypothetical protein